jgi:metal-responsive CopG/Arc/MetJ family transcriptional regulator
MEDKKFRNISFSADLVADVEKYIREECTSYRSIAEFFSEAARLRLEQLRRNNHKGA